MTPEQIEKMIKDYRIGPNSRLMFKKDPQEYWVKNISPNRKDVFLTINGAQTYRKSLKNIIKVDNKYVNTIHEETSTNKTSFDKAIRRAYALYQKAVNANDTQKGPSLLRKTYDLLDTYEQMFNEKYPFEMSIDPEGKIDIPSLNENDDSQTRMRLDKQIRVFIHNFGGPENFKKVQEILADNGIEFEKKVASFSDKELSNISGLLISTNLAPKAVASSQKYKGTVEVLKNTILKDFPQIKYREFKSLAEVIQNVLEAKFSKKYNNDPKLKGKQKKLPDALQKAIINKLKESKSFTKALILNESKQFDAPVSENLRYHISKNIALIEGIFRAGSTSHIDLIKEARDLWENGVLQINDEITKKLFENTDIGKFGLFEGEMVPLDFPLAEYETLTEGELEEADKKNPPIGKPHRGGSKKFYVYVRDPKTKNIKKVSFGQVGMSAKINDPKARKAFAARHKCAQKKDKTKPSYWSCRLPRYAKLLGLKTTFTGYW